MQQPDNQVPAPVEPDPLDTAEAKSEKAWEDADKAVDDLKKLGHEDDETETPE